MSYRLSKLSFGTNKIEKIFTINTDLFITSFLHIDDFGFLFLLPSHHCIGFADDQGNITLPWMGYLNESGDEYGTSPHFNFPSSICYSNGSQSCFVIEAGGSKIKQIDMQSRYCRSISISSSIDKYYSKTPSYMDFHTSCDVDKYENLYWVVKDLHRCFRMPKENNIVINYMGNGHSDFSISNNLNLCLLSKPYGIQCVNDVIYVADSGNHCIREIRGEITDISIGNPLNEKILSSPSQIVHNNGIIYIVDGMVIKYLSLHDKNNGALYTSPHIVAIGKSNKKDLYVLESE